MTEISPQILSADEQPAFAPPAGPEPAQAPAEPEGFSRRLLIGSIVISCVLHVAGAAAMLGSSGAMPEYGVISEQTDAISVEMAPSAILEAIEASPSEAAAAAVATATQQGNPVQSSAEAVPLMEVKETALEEPVVEEVKASDVTPDSVEPTEDPLNVVRGAGESSDQIETETSRHAKEEQKEPEKKEELEKQEVKVQQQQSAPQVSGGVTARSTAQAESEARISASRGSILSYAARVRAQVARNKPSGNGHHGTARVSFAVTSTGELSYARVASSSGSATLDEKAVSAVLKAAPFGAPPADAGPDQLRFSIPFYFR